MPAHSKVMTVGALRGVLEGMNDADELPVKVASYEGDHGMGVYSIRKHVVTDEEDTVTDAYVVING